MPKPPERIESRGPIMSKMPVFGKDNGEIMTVVDEGGDFITVFTEDPDNLGTLIPTLVTREEYMAKMKEK